MLLATHSRKNAFTLIETLLIVAILVVLVGVGVESYVVNSKNFKIDKTAQEMQYLMQAASAYYNESAIGGGSPSWPAKNGYTDAIPSDFKRYVPVDASAYHKDSILNNYGFYYQINGQPEIHKPGFRVKTQVPNLNIANLIAKKLPYGTTFTEGSDVYVEAGVYPPGSQLSDPTGFTIKKLGTYTFPGIPNPDPIYSWEVNCPIGQTAGVFSMITALKQYKDKAAYWLYYKVDVETIVSVLDSHYLISFVPTYESKTQDLRITPIPSNFAVSYIVYCKKN